MLAVTLPGSRVLGVARRAPLAGLSLVAGLALVSAPILSAQPARSAPPPPSARTLLRVAEAVDGHRSGATVWVVVSDADSIGVIGVFPSLDTAQAVLSRTGDRVRIMGPFATTRDPGPRQVMLIGCVHDPRSAMGPRRYCPDVIPLADVSDLALTVSLRNGTVRTVPIPVTSDAMFFSLSAIDKFVLPYYTRVLGAAASAQMRQSIVSNMERP